MRKDLMLVLFDSNSTQCSCCKIASKGEKRRYRLRYRDPDEPAYDYPSTSGMPGKGSDYSRRSSGWPSWSIIRKQLEKAIGRKWDDVWSEICQQADSRTYLGRQVRESFLREVNTDWPNVNGRGYWDDFKEFCVDRRDGILRKNAWKSKRYYEIDPPRPRDDDKPIVLISKTNKLVEYHKIDGSWFELRHEERRTANPVPENRQAWMLFQTYSHPEKVLISKKALNKREIRDRIKAGEITQR
jgi:hypothetical protein